MRYLSEHGFRKIYAESDLSSSLVHEENGIIERTSKERNKDFVKGKLQEIPESQVPDPYEPLDLENTLMRGTNVYFSQDSLEYLPEANVKFNRDTQDKAFFYFENGFAEVTADGFELRPYEELERAIWDSQIVDREFNPIRSHEALKESDWYRFLKSMTGGDKARLNALTSALGCLLHGYKDSITTKAIIFMDEAISDVPSGRTGKSLVAEALQKLIHVHRIDARNLSFGGQFTFQSIGIEHQVVDFNDAPDDFPFGRLFSIITDDMQVERKYEDEVTIPFEDSPKFLISTNYVIEGEGPSFEDRVFPIEFAPHYDQDHRPDYDQDHRPVDEFGHRFFEEWDEEQWRAFDTLMILFVQQHLRNGLHGYEKKNLNKRRLIRNTSREFAEWIIEFAREKPGEHKKSDLFNAFLMDMDDRYGDEFVFDGKQNKFTSMCHEFGRIYTGRKLSTRKSGSDRYITIPDLGNGDQD